MKKNKILKSLTAAALCCVMLVGSTWAWFSDTAESGKVNITAGNLKVDIVDSSDNSYKDKSIFTKTPDNIEPGVMFVSDEFKVVNNGNLALKYKLDVRETKHEGDKNLMDVVQTKIVKNADLTKAKEEVGIKDGEESTTTYSQREQLWEKLGEKAGEEAADESTGVIYPSDADDVGDDANKGSTAELVVVLFWKSSGSTALENKDNEYNKKDGAGKLSASFELDVFATQVPHESDSFGDKYDDGIEFPVTKVAEKDSPLVFKFPNNTPTSGHEGETDVEFPAGAFGDGDVVTLTLDTEVAAPDETITLPDGKGQDMTPVAVIDLTLAVNGEPVHFDIKDENQSVLISTKITAGLKNNVSVVYNGDGEDPTEVTYISETGALSFRTTHFSEFVVLYSDATLIMNQEELREAFAEANAAEEPPVMKLGADFAVDDGNAPTALTKQATLDLNGHTLTLANPRNRAISVGAGGNLTVTDSKHGTDGAGHLVLNTKTSGKQAVYAKGTGRTKTANVKFENIDITVQNDAHGTTSYAGGNYAAVFADQYGTVDFSEGTTVSAIDEQSEHCCAYVAFAAGTQSNVNISGAEVTADGTVTPFMAGSKGNLNMTSGVITISSNNGSAALSSFSGTVNMSGGTINVTGNVSGGRGSVVFPSSGWGNYFKDCCLAVGTPWTDGGNSGGELNITSGTINLTPTKGTAFGMATLLEDTGTGIMSGGTINIAATDEGIAGGLAGCQRAPVQITGDAIDHVSEGENNVLLYNESPFADTASIDRRGGGFDFGN